MHEQPTVFISSTIYDFRDLRSALKYLLEELGYRVLLSEFNDFTKPLDQSSYEACLAALREAHYFILLIGGRTGGWYNQAERVTITQHEYRAAYNLLIQGRMKLLTFVRAELWNAREDRAALRRFLEGEYKAQHELGNGDIAAITHHESTLVNDAATTFAFLREVGRVEEMKVASATGAGFPVGNWIHQFTSFRDIVDVLRTEFRMTQRLSRIALAEGLRRELLGILQTLTFKSQPDEIAPCTLFGRSARTRLAANVDTTTALPGDDLVALAIYVMTGMRHGATLPKQFIDHALMSGEFLEFDQGSGQYSSAGPHAALHDLGENVARLRLLIETADAPATRLLDKYKAAIRARRSVIIPTLELMPLFGVLDCQKNVICLTTSLYNYLIGRTDTVRAVRLRPTSPVAMEAEKVSQRRPSMAELDTWTATR